MKKIEQVDSLIVPGRFPPRWGWHDDHREKDGTPEYLPALMQARSEFAGLLSVIESLDLFKGKALQLGVGECNASHVVWNELFVGGAVTVDFNGLYIGSIRPREGGDTHDAELQRVVDALGPYDFLFIDAGHSFDDVRRDYVDYGQMVRRGGLIAFHDSLPRERYPEVEVHRFLYKTFGSRVRQIGGEVGIAWVYR